MLQLFRRNILLNVALLLPYIFIVHGGRFFVNYGSNEPTHAWLFQKLINFTSLSEQYLYYLSHILIFVQAILLNHIANRVKIVPEGQLFPALVFVVLTGLHSEIFGIGPVLIANLFFILALRSICEIYLMKNATLNVFNFGFFVAIASLFYPPYFWVILLGVFGLTVFRGFNLKEFLQLLSGFVTAIILFFSYLYITNELEIFWNDQIVNFMSPYIFSMIFSSKGVISMIIILLIFVLVFVKYNFLQIKAQIAVQKFFDFMFWIAFISLLSLFFFKIDSISHILIFLTPLSILVSVILARLKNELMTETIHLIFVLLALFLQLQNW